MDLKGKVAVVTGGGTGLGREISLQLAREGADVVVVYSRSETEAAETVGDLKALGSKAAAIKADVSKSADITSLIEQVMRDYGRIDVLVNNAGTTVFVDLQRPRRYLRGRLGQDHGDKCEGAVAAREGGGTIMKRQGRGSIIQTTSVAGTPGWRSSLAYTVSKAAETQLTRALAMAMAPEVTVNAIAPGLLATLVGVGAGRSGSEQHRGGLSLEEAPDRRRLRLGRFDDDQEQLDDRPEHRRRAPGDTSTSSTEGDLDATAPPSSTPHRSRASALVVPLSAPPRHPGSARGAAAGVPDRGEIGGRGGGEMRLLLRRPAAIAGKAAGIATPVRCPTGRGATRSAARPGRRDRCTSPARRRG